MGVYVWGHFRGMLRIRFSIFGICNLLTRKWDRIGLISCILYFIKVLGLSTKTGLLALIELLLLRSWSVSLLYPVIEIVYDLWSKILFFVLLLLYFLQCGTYDLLKLFYLLVYLQISYVLLSGCGFDLMNLMFNLGQLLLLNMFDLLLFLFFLGLLLGAIMLTLLLFGLLDVVVMFDLLHLIHQLELSFWRLFELLHQNVVVSLHVLIVKYQLLELSLLHTMVQHRVFLLSNRK